MRKNGLTCAVIAGIAGVAGFGSIADAVNLNPDGLGQVLIYPYYTTQGGNDTLFSVVNTADIGKAVKVRFLEGRNSREVLDFHLYLSPYDVWTAGIIAIPEGAEGHPAAGVYTTDRSCTVPDIVTNDSLPAIGGTHYVPFVNWAYVHPDSGAPLDHTAAAAAVLSSVERTREGYFEVIEMANVVNAVDFPVANWIRHGATGVPANCAAVNAAWGFGADWPNLGGGPDYTYGLADPDGSGQLFGNAWILNAARGTVAGYNADAIEGFNFTATLHQPPGDTAPGLEAVNNLVNGSNEATAYVFDFGQLVTATYVEDDGVDITTFGKIDAISALYTSPVVINEYYLDGEANGAPAQSEWLITFPTKRYYVDRSPYLDRTGATVPMFNPQAPREPFTNLFGNTGSCETIAVSIFDQEERTPTVTGGPPFSPVRPGAPANALCWEAQVVTFNQGDRLTAGLGSEILGSTYYNNLNTPFDAGWARISWTGANASLRESLEGNVFAGLPVTGFFANNRDNSVSDAGVLANYTALFRHRTERDCTNAAGACS